MLLERLESDKFPNPSTFIFWKMNFRSGICSASTSLVGDDWNQRGEFGKPMELVGNNLLNFETFDAKVANSLKKSLVTNDQDCVHW